MPWAESRLWCSWKMSLGCETGLAESMLPSLGTPLPGLLGTGSGAETQRETEDWDQAGVGPGIVVKYGRGC